MKRIILFVVILAVIIGVLVYFVSRDREIGGPAMRNAVRGQIVNIDLEQAMVDGPYVVTIKTAEGVEEEINIPSMGIMLCEAREAITSVSELRVGQTVEVNGTRASEGAIVPCDSRDHYFRIVS